MPRSRFSYSPRGLQSAWDALLRLFQLPPGSKCGVESIRIARSRLPDTWALAPGAHPKNVAKPRGKSTERPDDSTSSRSSRENVCLNLTPTDHLRRRRGPLRRSLQRSFARRYGRTIQIASACPLQDLLPRRAANTILRGSIPRTLQRSKLL